MPWGVAAAAIAAGSAAYSADKQHSASREQLKATREAQQLSEEQYAKQQADLAPFREAGLTSTNELMRQLGLGGDPNSVGYGSLVKPFSIADYQADPGYQFRLQEGLKQLDSTAKARGGLLSGATLKGTQRYAQDAASQEYGNAYNRYMDQVKNRYNMLSGQQATGSQANNLLINASDNYSRTAGDLMTQAGNARASSYIGSANAVNSGLGSLSNALAFYGSMRQPQGDLGVSEVTTTKPGAYNPNAFDSWGLK